MVTNVRTADNDVLRTLDTVHAKIHEGKVWNVNVLNAALGDTGHMTLHLYGITENLHMTLGGFVQGLSTSILYEGPTYTSGGTPAVPINRNRVGSFTAPFSGRIDATFSGNGDILSRNNGSSSSPFPGEGNFYAEWLLKSGTEYLIDVQNVSGGAISALLEAHIYQA